MVQYLTDIFYGVSTALKGMGITIKHIWRKPVTQQYPDERWVMPERFKGFVFNDTNRCNACNQCVKACPVDCIYLETDGKGKDRYMTRYAIDYNKCIWCGFCCEPCPDNALSMSHDYDHSLYFRDSLVYEFVPADKPVPCHREKRIEQGYWVAPKKEKPAKPAADKPAVDTPAAAKPVGDKPAVAKPVADEAAVDKPVADKPVVGAAVTAEPAVAAEPPAEPASETPADDPPAVETPAVEPEGKDDNDEGKNP